MSFNPDFRGYLRLCILGAVTAGLFQHGLVADETTYLPGAAETPGLNGALFSSTLTIFNPAQNGVTVRVGLIPFTGKPVPAEATRTLAAGETLRIPSVLATLFGLSQDAGTLVATSSGPLLYSLSTQNVADPSGAYGLALLPVPETSLLQAGQVGHAVWVSQSAGQDHGYRTNVSVTLVDPGSSVDVRVYDGTGAFQGQTTVASSSPISWQSRLVDLTGGAALEVGRVEFAVTAGRATAYTVLNDNVTSDAIASQAETAATGPSDRLLNGVAKSPGLGGAYWSTDVRLFNPSDAPLEVTIDALGFAAPTTPLVRTIPPRGLLELPKVLDLFGLPDGVAGALRLRAVRSVIVGARTLNSDPSGLRPGTFSAQQLAIDLPFGLLSQGNRAFFTGIDQTFDVPGVRTNLALFGGPEGASGRLVLSDQAGTERASTQFTRGPFEWGQLNVADWFPALTGSVRTSDGSSLAAFPAASRVDVELSTGSLDGYVSRIDNGSGDPITQFMIHETPFCGVATFAIEPFAVTPTPLAIGQQGTLAWDFVRDGSPIHISGQELSIDGGVPQSLGLGIRSSAVQFASTGPHSASLTGHLGCRAVTRSLDIAVCGTLTITPASLPDGRVMAEYAQTLGSDGIAPLSWTRTGDLPTGIAFDAATGILSGRPLQSGTFTSTYTVTDAHGCTGSASLSLHVNCGPIEISPASLPNGLVGTPYGPVTLDYQGGVAGGSWRVADGALPPGLSLTPAGVLSGTPTSAGSYTFTVRVTDGAPCSGQRTYTVTICNPITVDPATIPGATATVPYSQALLQIGGVGTTTFAITSGTLPADLTLSPAGLLSGTPTVTGSFTFKVTATDSLGCTGSRDYTLQVACPTITLSPASLPNATAANAYSQTLTASGGVGAKTFTVTLGALPAGLTLSSAGVLSGTPTVTGTFNFTVTATDTNGCKGTLAYTLTVVCPTITISPTTLPNGTAGVAYTQAFTASGGIGPYTYAVTLGALPAVLSLSSAGTLSGTPTVTGTFNFTVTATDANGCTGTQALSLTIVCQTITVTNPSTATGTANSPFSQTFTQSGAIGMVTFSTTSALPNGMGLSATGVLSGTPTQTGTFPIVVKVTDGNGCTGTGSTYTLVIACQTITVTNPATTTGTANSPFSQTFTQSGAIGTATFSTTSALPTGMGLSATGVLSGTPTQTGTFPIVIRVTDSNGCTGNGPTYTLVIACQTIAVFNPATTTGTASSFFSQTFTQSGAIGTATFSTTSGLPTGVTLSVTGVLSGTPTQTGTFPIVVKVTDSNGCTGNGPTYTLVISCQTINVFNPATTTGVAGSPFSQSFTQSGAIGTATFTTASALPTGLSLASNGTLSGTPQVTGTFPIVVVVTDANGCTGTGPTYTLVISCQTISVFNPATTTGVVGSPFSQSFTQSGAIGTATFTTASALPTGLSLASNGTLSGTPQVTGTFPIVVTVTDANGCTGTGATYTLVISCQTITVGPSSLLAGTTGVPYPSITFSQTSGIGTTTFSAVPGTLPTGLTLASDGTLSGTPTAAGSFPITVTATDSNGCTGSRGYILVISCPGAAITLSPGSLPAAAKDAPYTATFSASGGSGTHTFVLSGALPTGLSFSDPTLSGTPTQTGTFPITVVATDGSGCKGSQDYLLVVSCSGTTVTVVPPSNSSGVAGTAFGPETFTVSGGTGPYTLTEAGALPPGMTFDASTGTLSGTPTKTGSFPITVSAADAGGCTGATGYTLVIACPTITVTSPSSNSDPAGTPLPAADFTFTQAGAIGGATFTTSSTLPTGVSLTTSGVLTGTPTQGGSFPIVVTVTDSNGCTGTSSGYTLTITCPVITVTNPGVDIGTAGVAFSQTFTQSGGQGTITWSESGTLPTGLSLNTATGVLSGTTHQVGTFPITVTATDQNGCTGTGATFNLTINCQSVTVTNPATNTGTVDTVFSQTFTVSGILDTVTWSETGALPAGITLNSATGVLSGTPTVNGTFPITVKATDTNGCFGTSSYTLTINCQTITVSNPATATGTVDAPFSQTFTQSGAHGSATFSTSSTLPAGLTLSSAGLLSGTPTVNGTFPITVTVTDANGCTGTGTTYNLTINCQTITVSNPATATGTISVAFSQTFTQSGAHGSATFSTASTLPAGLSLSSGGVLSGTPTQTGTFPVVVVVTDSNGCTGTGATYTLVIACPTITVTDPVDAAGTVGTPFSETFTRSGGRDPVAFSYTTTGVSQLFPTTDYPYGVAVDAAGNVYVADSTTLWKWTAPSGSVTALASGLSAPRGVAVDGAGNVYFTEAGSGALKVWTPPTGPVTTLAPGLAAPMGVALDAAGNVYIADFAAGRIAKWTAPSGPVSTLVSGLALPNGVGLDAAGNVYFSEIAATGTISKWTSPAGPVSTLVTGLPLAVVPIAVDGAGDVYFADGGAVKKRIASSGAVTTLVSGLPVAFSVALDVSGGVTLGLADRTVGRLGLPLGLTLDTSTGVLAGTPARSGTFPITVTATDADGCTGTGATYTLVIACNTITVTNPVNATGTVGSPFSEQFTQTGGNGSVTFSFFESGVPAGLSLSSSGLLSGTPTQSGTFYITVKVTDGNLCSGTGAVYPLDIACNAIAVTNPGTDTGTAGVAFSQTFTQSGGNGTVTWSKTGTLPSGITLSSSTGVLSGTTTQVGSFPITVTATDSNGCQGTGATYTLLINCQTITVTNPGVSSSQTGTPFSQTFTASGILGTATWSETGALPSGITLDSTTGVLSGTPTQIGTFPITVKVTDTNGCFGTSSYTLTITCPTITITRVGGGSFPAATFNVDYPAGNQFQASCSGCTGTIHWSFQSGAQPPGINLTIVAGTLSGIPSATGQFTMTVIATDTGTGCSSSASFPFTIKPNVAGDSYSNLVNNTEAVVPGGSTTSPTTPFVSLTGTIISNDVPASGVAVDASSVGTFATTQGGSVTIAADGTFKYTPPLTAAALSSDTFGYTASSNTGTVPSIPQYAASTGPATATGTVTLNLAGRVWYVKNDGPNGNGQSQSPFNGLSNFTNPARVTPDAASDIIYVYNGDGTTTNQNAGVVLLANEQLIGQGVPLVVNGNTLVVAGTKPQITNTTAASDVVTLDDGNTVKGLTITGATRDGIAGNTHAGFTADTLTVQNNTNVGVDLIGMTGTVTITNSTISTVANQALTINAGTAAVTVDDTNTVNGGTGTAVAVLNRPLAAGAIAIGAAINSGQIQLLSNTSGTISFTGTQTMSNGTVDGVTMTTNAGATVNFSGTLNVTTTTGTPFQASGGGTLNVTGTANLTSGAAANGLSLNGTTVGGSGVTFTSVKTAGATTGINLVNDSGTVTVNGGTISGGTTGVLLQGASTSLSLAGVTINGPATGITNTTNFGTLNIGASVSVSATTALNLAFGSVSGTFASVSSTGGTNGVNLSAVTGTWGTTAGALTGATGSTFNVTGGGGGTISWGGTINQASAANVVTIAASNSNAINFSGNVTTSGTSTGISIVGNTGTYNFTGGASTLTGTGGGIVIANESGTISFGSGYSINGPTTPFKIGGTATNVSAGITYGGTITNNNNNGVLLDINSSSGTFNGTLTMNGTSLSGTVAGLGGVITVIKNMTGTLAVNNLSLSSSNTSFNNTLLAISGTNTAGTFTFDHLTLSATGTSHTGKGLTMSGGGTLTITGTGGASSIDVSSTALDLTGVALGASTIGTVSSSGGVNGIKLTTVTGGTFGITGGTLAGNTGSAFLVSGASASVSYGGSITQNTTNQRAVDIQGATGGTTALSGAIGSSTGAGIYLASNTGATINFTGTLTLSTGANNAFTATGGGTVSATGTGSTITTTSGIAVNVAGITIGATHLTFQSVSANGAVNGIVLTNTTGGAFRVTGDGSTNGSGGTIQGTTGDGINLANVGGGGVSLAYMNVTNPGLTGIQAAPVGWTYGDITTNLGINNFSLDHCIISDNAGNVSLDDGVTLENASGSVTITNSSITAARHQGATIDNYNTNMASLTMTGSTVTGTVGGDGMLIQMRGTSVMTSANVQSCTFSASTSTGLQVIAADTARIGSSSGGTITAPEASNAFFVQSSTFTNNNAGIDISKSQSSNVTFKVLNNTFTGHNSQVINSFTGAGAGFGGAITGVISGNQIGTQGVMDSGSAIGSGIRLIVQGDSTQGYYTVDGNQIREVANADTITLFSQNGNATSGSGAARFKITNNVLPQPSGSNLDVCGFGAPTPCMPDGPIFLLADEGNDACALITGNTIFDATTMNAFMDIYLATRTGPPTGAAITIQTGSAGGSAAALAYLDANNTLNGPNKSFDESGTTVTTVASCGNFP